ncbi:phage holin family protein [Actinomyces faecalis]|uniref:phage holin family protein n=1 Tax=Actinomyces faecalis TaxID=2722820 RepID=UPI0015563CF4|nr:phage holin family protein [Actinomyces faecalis]
MELVARTLGNAAGLWLAVAVVGGLSVPGSPSTGTAVVNFLVVGLVLALVNSVVKPVARFVAFPLYIVTFGLFALVVNGLMLVLTSHVTDWVADVVSSATPLGLHVAGFGSAVLGSVIVSIASAVIVGLLGPREEH